MRAVRLETATVGADCLFSAGCLSAEGLLENLPAGFLRALVPSVSALDHGLPGPLAVALRPVFAFVPVVFEKGLFFEAARVSDWP